ncbi:DUF1186 domain-containing protein [Clostridium sp. MT-14]|uniref:DUF1186 domain-containing protein n=1 Tax=unclassified Clostridium TaxID=2614128 RepID=UPI001239E9B9|nr:DUF1186 domain-containing protein [Clostridium sp. HV4-5-A1G]KAA8675094.1 DUF1186 domain-containing protein [Clostridium sp. HV4-5-A1G]
MNKLLEQIQYYNNRFPKEQLREIINKKEEFIPDLLEILMYTKENYEEVIGKENYFGHIYAIYLLAQFREKKSFPLIMDLISLPGDIPFGVLGDTITEDLDRIIASVCDSDVEPIKRLIENSNINEYVRISAIRVFLVLFSQKIVSRSEVIEYYKTLFNGGLERKFSQVWGGLISACCDIKAFELLEDIKEVFDEELIEPSFISREDVKFSIPRGSKDEKVILKGTQYSFIEDTIKELEWWACFQERDTYPQKAKKGSNINKNNKKRKNKRKQAKASKKKQRKK